VRHDVSTFEVGLLQEVLDVPQISQELELTIPVHHSFGAVSPMSWSSLRYPALLIKTSAGLPKVVCTEAKRFFTCSSDVMSALTGKTLDDGLILLSSVAIFSSASILRAAITMPVAPARAQTLAAAWNA
jgi:hypothetical protein